MPLPAGFPVAPKRPPSSVASTTADGTMTKSWLTYYDALDRFNEAVRVWLDTH